MKKHFHIGIGGTFSVLADSLEDAITEVHSWFIDAKANPYVEETDDNEHSDYCSDNEKPLPDGLQKYIDRIGLNILYQNYYKSTNGIWSRAEVVHTDEFVDPDDIEMTYYEVCIVYGCQDDTRSEQYDDTIFVHFDKTQECWSFGYYNPEISTSS